MKKLLRLYHTLKYLKPTQITYRLYYLIRKKWRSLRKFKYDWAVKFPETRRLKMIPSIINNKSYQDRHFTFLYLEKKFSGKIDWNYNSFGKLWTYNLNYFEYLHQAEINQADGLSLIEDFVDRIAEIKDGIEPFPTSLRTINWIKFLSKHQIESKKINQNLYAQVKVLLDHLEYHLLGNHLLENGFALFFAGYYFKEPSILERAKSILLPELKEQILPDGAHFELSPMYHQLMLYRILDCINLMNKNQDLISIDWGNQLKEKANLMLGWMEQISFSTGEEMPLLNDSTNGIAPTPKELKEYAKNLGLVAEKIELKDCGYRKFKNENYEILVDVGEIGPSYIPGHAHSDSLSFVLYEQENAVIVDPGISTYEKNQQRTKERSSQMHNTVLLKEKNSSDVWGGFRVGRRARIKTLVESETSISATHDGYRFMGMDHTRTFNFQERQIEIVDVVSGNGPTQAKAYFHFHPEENIDLEENKIIGEFGEIYFSPKVKLLLESYSFSLGFNKTKQATKAIVEFDKKLKTIIQLK